ncbi:uncharacterized protein G6M90_00g111910 [Metarhizium brunneum]|uniref:Ketoreductase (KR) domain-containing protein n=1 Tax=Metarhizium brunneum TaxID=500148 RepID=A0A7D5Z7Y1_9HYPO|nr:hypothetical protein G6M90_00g111910 [Metarhizium brunneum]
MDPNATFVIAGGLGGIGHVTKPVDELQSKGVRVETPACDIRDLERTRETFGKLMPEMPSTKGALQMSIVDCLFDDLEYDDWSIAVRCKTVRLWSARGRCNGTGWTPFWSLSFGIGS